ncbi:MAG: hypothetical protein CMJ94_13055 [Planctomycetes bacterium]|nr:hypothetical protein [Planctomycetota bacterium]
MIRFTTRLIACGTLAGLPLMLDQEPAAGARACCATEAAQASSAVSLASLPSTAAPQLDQIKQLVGDWYEVGEGGKPSGTLVSQYRETAGGHAVIETLFPGTEHEMISIYHMDGGDLLLTHYCVLGNAPTYRAERSEQGLIWRCQGAHNLARHGEAHMHEGQTRFLGKNRIEGKWLQTVDGEVSYTAAFDLMRVAPQAK